VDYTLSEVVKLTGARRRSVQLWAEAGVIKADGPTERAGSGTHRRFSRDEAVIACIVHAFVPYPIGELLDVAAAIRRLFSHQPRKNRSMIESAVTGSNQVFLVMSWVGEGAGTWGATLKEFAGHPQRDQAELAAFAWMTIQFLTQRSAKTTTVRLNTYLEGRFG
jgi:hypothetical protein